MCNPTGCNIIPFSQNVGVEDDEAANKIKVYPNPVVDYFTVQGVVKGTELTLTDVTGKTVLTQLLQGNNNKVDISALQKGIYIVHLSQCYIMYKSFKIVKQ